MGTGKILGNSLPGNEIVVSVIEAPPLAGSGLGGSYILLFASRDGGAWVVTHEVPLDLSDVEQLSLSHEQCTLNGTYAADLVAVLAPPVVDGVVDLAARKWQATQAWTYAAGELTKQAPESVACSLTGE